MKRSSQPRTTAELSKALYERLNTYALAASAAGVGMLALVQPAEAKIVYTPANIAISPGTRLQLDLNHDGFSDFSINNTSSSNAHTFVAFMTVIPLESQNKIWGRQTRRGAFAPALHAGVRIGPAGQFSREGGKNMGGFFSYYYNGKRSHGYVGPWANGGKGVRNRYLGLKFIIKGKVHFGWARLTVSTKKPHIFGKLTGYAYETVPGKSIVAGETKGLDNTDIKAPNASLTTPTPVLPMLGLLAGGAPMLSIWRREELVDPKSRAR
jgi:hypothetical protein